MKKIIISSLFIIAATSALANDVRIAFSKTENIEIFARNPDANGQWCADDIEINLSSANPAIDYNAPAVDQMIIKVGEAVIAKNCASAQRLTVYRGDNNLLLGVALKDSKWAMIRDGANEEDEPTGEESVEENTTAETSSTAQTPTDSPASENNIAPKNVATTEKTQPAAIVEPVVASEKTQKVTTPELTTNTSIASLSNDAEDPSAFSKLLKGIESLIEKLIHTVMSLFITDPIDLVKNGRMDFDKSVTIGQALEHYKYFNKIVWTKSVDPQGRMIVKFAGRIDFKSYIGTKVEERYTTYTLTANDISKAENAAFEKDIKILHIIDFSINEDNTFQIHRIHYASYNSKAIQMGEDMEDANNTSMNAIYKNTPDTIPFWIVYGISH